MLAYLLILASVCELFSAINHKREMLVLELMLAKEKPKSLPEGLTGMVLRNTVSLIAFSAAILFQPVTVFPYMLPIFCLLLAQYCFQHKRVPFLFVADYSITSVCYFLSAVAIRNL